MADNQYATATAAAAAELGLPLAPVRVPASRVVRLTLWAWRDVLRTRSVTGTHHTELTLRLHGEAHAQEMVVRTVEARRVADLEARTARCRELLAGVEEPLPEPPARGFVPGMSRVDRVQWAEERRTAERRAAAVAEARSVRARAEEELRVLEVRRREVAEAAAWAARGWAKYADLQCAVYTRERTGLLGLRRGQDVDATVPAYEAVLVAAGSPALPGAERPGGQAQLPIGHAVLPVIDRPAADRHPAADGRTADGHPAADPFTADRHPTADHLPTAVAPRNGRP